MKVILTQDVPRLGAKMELKDVSDGYARNYLLPRGLAVIATRGAEHQVEKLVEERDRKQRKERDKANELTARLEGLELTIATRAGASGHLYGEVTSQRIAEELSSQHGIAVERKHIKANKPIRVLGGHTVEVRIAPSVSVNLALQVVPESE